jgi:hypothetical protein
VQNGFGTGANAGALRGGGFDYALIDVDNPYRPQDFYPGTTNLSWAAYPDANVAGTTGDASRLKLTKVIGTAAASASTSKHGIDAGSNTGTIWGNGPISATANYGKAGVELTCGSCHDPHGNGNYRILKPMPDGATGPSGFTGVAIADSGPTGKVYTTDNYWAVDNKDATIPKSTAYYPIGSATARANQTSFIQGIGAWCSTCHSRYAAPQGSWGTSSGDAVFTYRHTSDMNYSTILSNTSYVRNGYPSSPSETRTCVQCHVAHGTNATMSGFADGSVGNAGQNPDGTSNAQPSKLLRVSERGTCRMCHTQAMYGTGATGTTGPTP